MWSEPENTALVSHNANFDAPKILSEPSGITTEQGLMEKPLMLSVQSGIMIEQGLMEETLLLLWRVKTEDSPWLQLSMLKSLHGE